MYFHMQREEAVFRALADPSRRAIFERLTRGEAAVKHLTARFDISQSAVSQHLATLRSAGLVSERREPRLLPGEAKRAATAHWLDCARPGVLARAPRPTSGIAQGDGRMMAKAETEQVSLEYELPHPSGGS
jgi:DNA-binding transcriptional ArsR family regulator